MPYLSSHVRRLREIKAAREKALLDNADGLGARVQAERRALDQCAIQLRAALLARARPTAGRLLRLAILAGASVIFSDENGEGPGVRLRKVTSAIRTTAAAADSTGWCSTSLAHRPRGESKTALPSHIQGHRETVQAREATRQENAQRVWAEVEAERRAVDELTARLRAMRLAQENAISGLAHRPVLRAPPRGSGKGELMLLTEHLKP